MSLQARPGGRHALRRRRPSQRRRRILLATAVVLALAAGTLSLVGVRGFGVADHLGRAAELLGRLSPQLVAGDLAGARATLASLQAETAAARDGARGTLWRVGRVVPVLGPNLAAAEAVAVSLDELSRQTLPPMIDLAEQADRGGLLPKKGAFNLALFTAAAPRLAVAAQVVHDAKARLSKLDRGALVGQVAQALTQLLDGLDRLGKVADTASRAATLMPALLGASGERTYLVLFQNLAEARATGGMPGAFIVVKALRGRVSIVDHAATSERLRPYDHPVLPQSAESLALYTDKPALFAADVNLSPDFPTAAATFAQMYQLTTHVAVDGVIAADPVALGYLLAATGSVKLADGSALTSANAVKVLLADSYARYPSAVAQNDFFDKAAVQIFQRLMAGGFNARAGLAALAQAAGERRLLLWSRHPQDAAQLAGTVLAGSLPLADGDRPIVGVFLNDASGAKLDYYLAHDAQLRVTQCRPDGRALLELRVRLRSTAPTRGLGPAVTGLALAGQPYRMRTNVSIFSPSGGGVMSMSLDETSVSFAAGTEANRSVGIVTIDLDPGQERTLAVRLLTDAAARITAPQLWLTPGVNPWPTSVEAAGGCPTQG